MKKISVILTLLLAFSLPPLFAQDVNDIDLSIDLTSSTIPTPKIFKANIDLSGHGFHQDNAWPQSLSAKETIDTWQNNIGYKDGLYRLQYNLWELSNTAKDKGAQDKLSENYESVIKSISDSGGTVILNIFGTPEGMGRIRDSKSAPVNMSLFKSFIKARIKYLSCEKKYNIWYEVWNAPDLEDFFFGRELDYLNLYRAIGESINELEAEYKINIPLGGPGTSWWFHNIDGNTVITPEKSLIYNLIKFASRNRLPLDFITWHGFSSDPRPEKEQTIYGKTPVILVREWLSYFNFSKETPLIIDEWNYDRDANVLPARKEKAYIAASYILARIKNMYEAGIDNQVYFALEDFQDNRENLTRNIGAFYLDSRHQHKAYPKAIYNAFRMLKELNNEMLTPKLNDEFVGALITKSQDTVTILIYNYIDPEIVKNYFSANIAELDVTERRTLLNIIRSDQLSKIMSGEEDLSLLHSTSRVKSLLVKAKELSDKARKAETANRNINLSLKNITGEYSYSRFSVDSSCAINCEFKPVQEKDLSLTGSFQEVLSVTPFSLTLIVLKKKPELPKVTDDSGK